MKIKEIFEKTEPITVNSYLLKCGVKDIEEFKKPIGKYLDDFRNYNNIFDGVRMFKYHMLQNDGAYILCDSGDTDGITSATILYDYMTTVNEDWDVEILLHTGKQRGLQDEELFKKVLSNPRGLLIIPDSGTNDLNEVNEIYEKTNMDVLVLDHHNLDTPIQKGVLINNQDELSKVSKNGSGCLVTHKFLEALDNELNCSYAKRYIDMVALSLISDSMGMFDEQNRAYYYYGLQNLELIRNPFIELLFTEFIGDRPYTQRDISFKVIPKINSICRSKDQELKQKVVLAFLGFDIEETTKLCAKAHKNQIETVNKIVEDNFDSIKSLANNELIVFSCDEMPRSYSGLIAGKIMGICGGKPTIVGKIIDDSFIGSLRSPIPLQKDLTNNELVEWARGHDDSCGIKIPKDNLQLLVDYYNSLGLSYEPCVEVLRTYSTKHMPSSLFSLFDDYNELWGQGIKKPQFAVTLEYNPSDVMLMGANKTTLKIKSNGIDIMFFFANKDTKEKLKLGYFENDNFVYNPLNKKLSLTVVGSLGVNVWKDNETNQIIVSDFDVSEIKKPNINDLF